MKNKTTNQLEIDQLLNLLNQNSEEKENLETDDIHRFLSTYDLKPGNNKIPVKLLLSLYNIYSNKKLKYNQFLKKIDLYLSRYRRSNYFLVNKQLDFLASTLFKHIKDKKDKKIKFRKHHFERFLKRFKIEQGDVVVQLHTLRKLYTEWIRLEHPTIRMLIESRFCDYLKLYFKFKITSNRRIYFYINKNIRVYMENTTNDIQMEEKKD